MDEITNMNRLNSARSGHGPDLVMLHGLFGSLDNFRSVSLHLARSLNVLRLDLPGHGQSPSLTSLSIESMADAVIDELAQLGIERFHLLGHSLGGKVAMSIAGRAQDAGLQSVCIVDIAPKLYPPHHENILRALHNINLLSLSNRRDADSQLRNEVADAGIRAFLLKSLFKHESRGFQWRFDLEGLAKDYALIRQAPVIERKIDKPALFIKGGNSDYIENNDESVIREHFAQPSLKIIEGAGHWPHAEKPALFTRICQDFFDSLPQVS